MRFLPRLQVLFLGAGCAALSACSLASLPKGYSDVEKQTVNELQSSNYVPRSAKEREAIETQDLFAQTAFWSREYELNPADLEAAINLSSTLRRMGKPKKSIEVAQTTRAMYPENVDLMAELAASYISDGKPKKAFPLIDKALARRPEMARLWSLKGAVLDQFGQYEQARQNYTRALAISPNDPGVLANVGLSYALEGDPKTAEIWLRRAASLPGASPAVRQNLALVLGLQNKYREAQTWAARDLTTQQTQENLSYVRELRGGTPAPQPMAQPTTQRQPSPAPRTYNTRPIPAQNSSSPRTYGANSYNPAKRVYGSAGQAQAQAQAQRQAYRPTPQPAQTHTAMPRPAPALPPARLSVYGQADQSSNRPQSSRDVLKAMQGQPPYAAAPHAQPAPSQVLDRLRQKNTPKALVAQQQQQQLIARARARSQYQARNQAQSQAQYAGYPTAGQPTSRQSLSGHVVQMTPQTYPQATAQGYGQAPVMAYPQSNMAPVPTSQQARPPARPRRH